jgi:hypothetical protein
MRESEVKEASEPGDRIELMFTEKKTKHGCLMHLESSMVFGFQDPVASFSFQFPSFTK